MHAMNTDQQTYYSNPTGPHQGTGGYYIANGVDQRRYFLIKIYRNISLFNFYRISNEKSEYIYTTTYGSSSKNSIENYFLYIKFIIFSILMRKDRIIMYHNQFMFSLIKLLHLFKQVVHGEW
jgi:hypothetical protein